MTCIIGTKKITVVDNFLPDYLFTKLSKYLEGYERAFPLCKSQCGKIISSIEKSFSKTYVPEVVLAI